MCIFPGRSAVALATASAEPSRKQHLQHVRQAFPGDNLEGRPSGAVAMYLVLK